MRTPVNILAVTVLLIGGCSLPQDSPSGVVYDFAGVDCFEEPIPIQPTAH